MNSKGALYHTLLTQLKQSTGANRTAWAMQIVDDEIDLQELSGLLFEEQSIATRYSWLLSDIGMEQPQKLFDLLPYLFAQRHKTNALNFAQQMVKYWRIAGIPEEQKGHAIDVMFGWLMDPKESTHIKTVSLDVLAKLLEEYPDLKNELKLCLEQQPEDIDISFKRKVKQIIKTL